MSHQHAAFPIHSLVIQTKDIPPRFFYEIWQALGGGVRWQIEISREFPTVTEAQKACDAEAQWYIAERAQGE